MAWYRCGANASSGGGEGLNLLPPGKAVVSLNFVDSSTVINTRTRTLGTPKRGLLIFNGADVKGKTIVLNSVNIFGVSVCTFNNTDPDNPTITETSGQINSTSNNFEFSFPSDADENYTFVIRTNGADTINYSITYKFL